MADYTPEGELLDTSASDSPPTIEPVGDLPTVTITAPSASWVWGLLVAAAIWYVMQTPSENSHED